MYILTELIKKPPVPQTAYIYCYLSIVTKRKLPFIRAVNDYIKGPQPLILRFSSPFLQRRQTPLQWTLSLQWKIPYPKVTALLLLSFPPYGLLPGLLPG